MEKKVTLRGFSLIEFIDRYDQACSLQKSSLATEDCIWFGVTAVVPQTLGRNGWEDYPVPKDVSLSARMHLTQDQVAELLPILSQFVETGEIMEDGCRGCTNAVASAKQRGVLFAKCPVCGSWWSSCRSARKGWAIIPRDDALYDEEEAEK